MKRPAGITISAVLAFVGSAIALFTAALLALSVTVAVPNGQLPRDFGYFATISICVALLFSAWGIISGVGLLNLREWSRISLLVFSVLLLVVAVPGCLTLLFVKVPIPVNTRDPEVAQHAVWITRLLGAALCALGAALAMWWLYYFNLRRVKEQFTGRSGASPALGVDAALHPGAYSGGRPLSITIIAGLLMMGAVSLPLMLVFHLPMMFLGYFFTGPQAFLIISVYTLLQASLAHGLWGMQPWARSVAIYYYNFAIFNAVISAILPGADARYQEAVAAMQSALNLPATPSQIHFPLWIALFFSLPFIAIQLGFLIASKKAFESPGTPTSSR